MASTTEERILEAARRVLCANPGATIDDIAAEALVGRATVFRLFNNRAGLLKRLARRAIAVTDQVTSEAAASAQTATEALRLAITAVLGAGEHYRFLGKAVELCGDEAFDRTAAQTRFQFEGTEREAGVAEHVLNDLSLLYVIVPFFAVELIRYGFLKRLDFDLIGDSVANVITFISFVAIEYALEFLCNTPSHHRVHHGSNRQYLDKNYAGMLVIWDRMFGTFEPEVEKVRYGVDRPIHSNNPLVVFLHGIHRLGSKLLATKGFRNKLRVLVKPPGWQADWA